MITSKSDRFHSLLGVVLNYIDGGHSAFAWYVINKLEWLL